MNKTLLHCNIIEKINNENENLYDGIINAIANKTNQIKPNNVMDTSSPPK